MKIRLILLLLISALSSTLLAQDKKTPFLFDKFEKGTLFFKDGTRGESLFNYNTVDEKLVFISPDSAVMEIANPSKTTIAKIGERVFEHVRNGMYYERIEVAPNTLLYVRWHSTMLSEGKAGAYGTKSTASSVESKSSMYGTSGYAELSVNESFAVKSKNNYFMKVKNKFKNVTDVSSFVKLFKENKEDVEKYIKEENIDWGNLEDVKKTVAYCSKYIKE